MAFSHSLQFPSVSRLNRFSSPAFRFPSVSRLNRLLSPDLRFASVSLLNRSSSPAEHSSLSSPTSVSFNYSPPVRQKPLFRNRSASVEAPSPSGGLAPAVALTENALRHLSRIRSERGEDVCLRIGVKQGGCSGLSYTMEFESKENTRSDDSIMEYDGFVIVCDPKSLLFLFGMQLDYSDALIGGGFNFKNPNATQTCGCGKSFAAEM